MRRLVLAAALASALISTATFAHDDKHDDTKAKNDAPDAALVKPQSSESEGSVTVEGKRIDYKAVAGTLVLHGKGDKEDEPTVSMFYTAYFKKGVAPGRRPITFIYNGGPGSATVWLHMGAFGPKRVVTSDDSHTPAAPYGLVNNDYSLLDASDLVFIDAPGAGFSRLIADDKDPSKRADQMKDRKKDIYSVDGDGHAFAQFITQFLSRYGRWNSPKYLFGESYGTTRSAVLANDLENEDSVDLNGVILLSQILNFDNSIDSPADNPGMDLPYVLAVEKLMGDNDIRSTAPATGSEPALDSIHEEWRNAWGVTIHSEAARRIIGANKRLSGRIGKSIIENLNIAKQDLHLLGDRDRRAYKALISAPEKFC